MPFRISGVDFRDKLIKEVRKNPCLYDRNDDSYKRYEMRVKIWTEIGRKFDLSAAEAQAKWKSVRDNMVKHIKRNMKKDPKKKKRKPYKFAHLLDFIIPYLEISRDEDDDEEEEDGEEAEGSNSVTNNANAASLVHDNDVLSDNEGSFEDASIGPSRSVTPSSSGSESPPLKRERYYPQMTFDPAVFDPGRVKSENAEMDDDIGLFLSSMAGSIRKLPPEVQVRVRFSIHKIVHDAEVEYLYPWKKAGTSLAAQNSTF